MSEKNVKFCGGILLFRSKSGRTKVEKVLVGAKQGNKKDQVKCKLYKFVRKKKRLPSKIPVPVKNRKKAGATSSKLVQLSSINTRVKETTELDKATSNNKIPESDITPSNNKLQDEASTGSAQNNQSLLEGNHNVNSGTLIQSKKSLVSQNEKLIADVRYSQHVFTNNEGNDSEFSMTRSENIDLLQHLPLTQDEGFIYFHQGSQSSSTTNSTPISLSTFSSTSEESSRSIKAYSMTTPVQEAEIIKQQVPKLKTKGKFGVNVCLHQPVSDDSDDQSASSLTNIEEVIPMEAPKMVKPEYNSDLPQELEIIKLKTKGKFGSDICLQRSVADNSDQSSSSLVDVQEIIPVEASKTIKSENKNDVPDQKQGKKFDQASSSSSQTPHEEKKNVKKNWTFRNLLSQFSGVLTAPGSDEHSDSAIEYFERDDESVSSNRRFIDSGLRRLKSEESRLYLSSFKYRRKKTTVTDDSDDVEPVLQELPSDLFRRPKRVKKPKTIDSSSVTVVPTDTGSVESSSSEPTEMIDMDPLKKLKELEDVKYKIDMDEFSQHGDQKNDWCLHTVEPPESDNLCGFDSISDSRKAMGDFCLHNTDPPDDYFSLSDLEKTDFCLHHDQLPPDELGGFSDETVRSEVCLCARRWSSKSTSSLNKGKF